MIDLQFYIGINYWLYILLSPIIFNSQMLIKYLIFILNRNLSVNLIANIFVFGYFVMFTINHFSALIIYYT